MRVCLGSLLLAFSLGTVALAEDPTPKQRGATVRGKLGQPSAMDAVSFEGDLTIDGLWAGTATLEAKPHVFAKDAVWQVVEKYFIDHKGVETHLALRYMLSPDLSLRSGRGDANIEGTKIATVFGPTGKSFLFIRTTTTPEGTTSTENLSVDAPKNVTAGMPALLLFARALGAEFDAKHVVPWLRLNEIALGRSTTSGLLTVAPLPKDERMQVGWGLSADDGERVVLHLSSDRRRLVRAESANFKIVPKGQGGKRIALSEEKPAETWQQAFLKFGYGYHMARKKLLEEAFHWPTMLKHEKEVTKTWSGPDDVEKFKEAWVEEFMSQSLRRSRKDTQRLLNMTLASGKIEKKTDDQVVFAAHKNFGGGTQRTYTLKKVDGTWYIAFVKF